MNSFSRQLRPAALPAPDALRSHPRLHRAAIKPPRRAVGLPRALFVTVLMVLILTPFSAPAVYAQQSPPQNEAAALVAEAKALWKKGEQERAIETIQRAIKADPRSPAGHMELALMYMELKDNARARTAVEEVLRLDPNYAPAHQRLGAILRRTGDFEGAIREAKLALTLKPDTEFTANSYETLGLTYQAQKRYAESADAFREVIRLTPNDSFAHEELVFALFSLRRYVEAEAVIRRAIEIAPTKALYYHNLGSILQNQGETEQALRAYEEYLRLNPQAPDRAEVERNMGWLKQNPPARARNLLLLEAANKGDAEQVKALLDKGADPNFKGEQHHQTPLRMAVALGHAEVVKVLLAAGAKDEDAEAEALAYENGRAEVEKLLAAAAPQPRPAKALNHLMFTAIRKGDTARARAMIEAGADEKDAALSSALDQDHAVPVEFVQFLLDRGALANPPDTTKTPLMLAARKGRTDIVTLLLAKGAGVRTRTKAGTALMMATSGGHTGIVKMLLAAGADVNEKDEDARTALMLASGLSVDDPQVPEGAGSMPAGADIMQLLLDRGADVNAKDNFGETALTMANTADKVRMLSARGADANAKDKYGESALHAAAENSNAEIVEALLQGGADANARDSYGATALIRTLQPVMDMPRFNQDDIGIFKQRLARAAPIARRLIEARGFTDVNARNKDGQTALLLAAELGETELVRLLVSRGADPNAGDKDGTSAFVVAYKKDDAALEKLLAQAAPLRSAPETLNAFLHFAIRKKDAARVRTLLDRGADPNSRFSAGPGVSNPALFDAARTGHAGIVKMLLDKGADPNGKGMLRGDESGVEYGTPLEVAGSPEVKELLQKAAAAKPKK